jgi:hypothetical protein
LWDFFYFDFLRNYLEFLKIFSKCQFSPKGIIQKGLKKSFLGRYLNVHPGLDHRGVSEKNSSMEKLQLIGPNLGQVFNFRVGCVHAMHLSNI